MSSSKHRVRDPIGGNASRVHPAVYLAGKIRQNCWRHRLVDGLREHSWGDGPLHQAGFVCQGPFFTSCDHACSHQQSSHGSTSSCSPDLVNERKTVIDLCLRAVAKSDLIFCFIDSIDCHGTLFELGYAVALRIPIVIAIADSMSKEQSHELWFPLGTANRIVYNVSEAQLPALLRRSIREWT
jgi:nucleoside 2-deoxyribosyltransferase